MMGLLPRPEKGHMTVHLKGIITAFVGILSILVGAATGQPATGLVAAYSFDEGVGTVLGDGSGNAHTGTIMGATWITGGRFGGCTPLRWSE